MFPGPTTKHWFYISFAWAQTKTFKVLEWFCFGSNAKALVLHWVCLWSKDTHCCYIGFDQGPRKAMVLHWCCLGSDEKEFVFIGFGLVNENNGFTLVLIKA